MDEVFKALADSNRRALLDALFAKDGQPLVDLCTTLPALSRFGVMKHLSILERARLVVTRRDGRHKLHYLNPVPIRLVHDRWISKFAAPWVQGMVELQHDLENPAAGGERADPTTEPASA